MTVVLASASPRRRELLAAILSVFDVEPADIDEPLGTDAVADAMQLARDKALLVAAHRPADIVIGADTVVFDEERLYGKPGGEAEAAAMLRDLSGRAHTVVTGICLASAGGARGRADHVVSTVWLSELDDAEIARYVSAGIPLDKAGAYAIQHDEHPVVERLEGCYCNVVGLPLWRLKSLLEGAGIPCADPTDTFARCLTCPDRSSSS